MSLDLTATLADLVSIPSVNPMGRDVSGPEFFEYRVTDYLEQLFRGLPVTWQRQTVDVQRDNIIARLDGDTPPEAGGPVVLLEAHQDTVPVDGMTIEPWTPTVRDGRLFGRGSCDIKGGMTAMLGALARLAHERPHGLPTIIMACTVNEEHGYTGATALTKLWTEPHDTIIPRRPDVAIVAEPTSLDVVVAHKGTLRWHCHTGGKAAHSSQPQMGDSAVYRMARVLLALQRYAEEEAPRFTPHPLCGGVTLSVGTIAGGISVNTVPDHCVIEIDRRLIPGEDGDEAYRQVLDYVGQHTGDDPLVKHDLPRQKGPALPDGDNHPLAKRLGSVAAEVSQRGSIIGVPYGTDASTIALAGVPSVVFGPGSIAQAHTCDEWLPLDELEQSSEILYRFLRDYTA